MFKALKDFIRPCEAAVVRISAKNSFLAGLYMLIRGGFAREHQAVLAGKVAYQKSLSDARINTSLLRRNVHRIEKGMLMRPRRIPFGLGYIDDTLEAYALARHANRDHLELSWATDVLDEYFRLMPVDGKLADAREKFNRALKIVPGDRTSDCLAKRIPYKRRKEDRPQIDWEQYLKLVRYRRSVRWYLDRPVPREMITRAVEAATYSPSACNRLPYEFRIIDSPDLVKKVISLPSGTAGFSDQVPAVAVVVGKLRNYAGEPDRHLIYIDSSLAAMAFVFALEVQGLASCCINWPDFSDREISMAKHLRLEPDERPIMLISFGWPDEEGLVANSTKKDIDLVCRFG